MVEGARPLSSEYVSTALMMCDVNMTPLLDKNLTLVNPVFLDNSLIAQKTLRRYKARMGMDKFRESVIAAMEQQGITKADLARKSGVSYHALDKFLKGASASTSADRAAAISNALGITQNSDKDYDELRQLYYQLSEERREFLLEQLRALVQR